MSRDPSSLRVADLIAESVLLINDGYRAKNEELGSSGLPFARAGNIDGGFHFEDADCFPEQDLARVGNKVSQPGDVVFTSKGTVGRFAYVSASTPRFVYSPQLCFWRALDQQRIDPRWLFYWVQSTDFQEQCNAVKGQTDMADYVSLRDQRAMWLMLPGIDEQLASGRVLGAIDDKIDLNRRMNQTLESMARALFRSWFVDFGPVVAKADGRRPFGVSPEIASLFPNALAPSSIGPIPQGWATGSILSAVRLLSGGTPKTSVPEYWNGTIPWASAADVSQCQDCFLLKPERTITPLGLEQSPTKVISAFSTVIVARGATTGRMCLFGLDMAMNQTCYGLRSKSESHYYVYCLAKEAVSDLVHNAHGSVFDTITTQTFESSNVVLPNERVVARFEREVEPFFRSIQRQQEESAILAALRDTLLTKLMSGELRARDVEKLVATHV